MSDICISCEEKCTAFGNLSLCHNCKIVYYTQNTTNRKELILNYLTKVQEKVLEQREDLYRIAQKEILGENFTSEEKVINDNMKEFQIIRKSLNNYLKENISLSTPEIRTLLYRLVMLSDWLATYFELKLE